MLHGRAMKKTNPTNDILLKSQEIAVNVTGNAYPNDPILIFDFHLPS